MIKLWLPSHSFVTKNNVTEQTEMLFQVLGISNTKKKISF